MSYNQLIQEIVYSDLLTKQKSITRLFPPFFARVRKIANMSGVSLFNQKLGLWHFKVASSNGVDKYDVFMEFSDIIVQLEKFVMDRRLWKINKSGVDLRRLSAVLLNRINLKIKCSCPAFQYWGPAYILTRRDAIYGKGENRPPIKRNPKQYGAYCKHCNLLLDVLPMYGGTFANYLKKFYDRKIKELEDESRKQYKGIKKITKFLGKDRSNKE